MSNLRFFMKSKRFISLSMMCALSTAAFVGALSAHFNKNVAVTFADATTFPYSNGDGDTYYSGISDSTTGSDLLSALRSLNSSKKKANGGYSNLLKDKKWARYTDYDLSQETYLDSNDMVYNTTILSFYSGNKSNDGVGMNREHVWPNSRGGNYVEQDSHMARPTLTAENSSRGNSFYVEGQESTSTGWDPAKPSFGEETYRGDSARIIFYCVVANNNLSLVDLTNDSTGNHTMGKLSDLLKWNLMYPVAQREENRNEGVQAIQGNRNPFIDHPEYACKIWGNANSTTKSICSSYSVKGLNISRTYSVMVKDATSTVSARTSDNSDITWENSDPSVVTLSGSSSASNGQLTLTALNPGTSFITAKATINGKEYTKTCKVFVKGAVPVTSISLNVTSKTLAKNETLQLVAKSNPKDSVLPAITWSSSNSEVASVTSNGLVTALKAGTATITVKTTDNKFSATCAVTVTENKPAPSGGGCGGNVATTSIVLSTLSILGVGLLLIKRKFSK